MKGSLSLFFNWCSNLKTPPILHIDKVNAYVIKTETGFQYSNRSILILEQNRVKIFNSFLGRIENNTGATFQKKTDRCPILIVPSLHRLGFFRNDPERCDHYMEVSTWWSQFFLFSIWSFFAQPFISWLNPFVRRNPEPHMLAWLAPSFTWFSFPWLSGSLF